MGRWQANWIVLVLLIAGLCIWSGDLGWAQVGREKNPVIDSPDLVEVINDPLPMSATVLHLQNEFLDVRVDGAGLFTMWTTGGDPDNPNDNNRRLLYGVDPWSSFSTIRVDGENWVFGLSGELVSAPHLTGDDAVECSYRNGPILVTERLALVLGSSTGQRDAVRISYTLTNSDASQTHSVAARVMLDTMLGENDGAPLRIPGTGAVTTELEYLATEIPQYWQAFDRLENPTIISQGSLLVPGLEQPSRFISAYWPRIYGTAWEYVTTPGLSLFPDSAVAVYWHHDVPKVLQPSGRLDSSVEFVTYYGLGGITVEPGQIAVSLTGPAELAVVGGSYFPNPFTVTAYVVNNTPITRDVAVTLSLPEGLELAGGSATQNIVGLASGAEGQVSWLVTARSCTDATTLTYSVTGRSSGVGDQSVSRDILLPAIEEVNRRPIALCQDVTVHAGLDCTVAASIDDGSFDPDGDPITLTQTPPGPYPIGVTAVTLTVCDDKGACATCEANVTVLNDPPVCNLTVAPAAPWVNETVTASVNCVDPLGQAITSTTIDWGDGNVVDGPGPVTHEYTAPCDYTITATCTDACGLTSQCSQTIKVYAPVDVKLVAVQTTGNVYLWGAQASWHRQVKLMLLNRSYEYDAVVNAYLYRWRYRTTGDIELIAKWEGVTVPKGEVLKVLPSIQYEYQCADRPSIKFKGIAAVVGCGRETNPADNIKLKQVSVWTSQLACP